jgi:hypothetical protein
VIDAGALDPLGFIADELTARGALLERADTRVLAIVPPPVARELDLDEMTWLTRDPGSDGIGCGLGSPLLDRLINDVRAVVPIARMAWAHEPPKLAVAERLASRLVVRNGVADILGVAHASATYVTGVFAWSAEADDRYEGMTSVVAHATSSGQPDELATAALMRCLLDPEPDAVVELAGPGSPVPRTTCSALAHRATLAIGPRLDEVGAAVARRRDRERGRIDGYFASLVAETKKPRRQIAREAIDARLAALRAEHDAKLRDLAARYVLRIKLEPIAFATIATRVAEVRLRLRRRKAEREVALHLPPGARTPDALPCAGCTATTRAPVLCDDALHALCETCAPDAGGRPRCPRCRSPRGRA